MLNFARKNYFKIGVVGYSGAYFDRKEARKLLETAIRRLQKYNNNQEIQIVSGLTNFGIPGVAYSFASENNYKTAGFACEKAREYPCFPVDEEHIIGSEWGDESQDFIEHIDCLIRIGGGNQSHKEVEAAKKLEKPIVEFDLPKMRSYCLMARLHPVYAKTLHDLVKGKKGRKLHDSKEYHITLRYWLVDLENKDHKQKVITYLKERFAFPIMQSVRFEGKTDVFGSEKSYVLLVDSPAFRAFQKELDIALQKIGAPPSDYSEYKPHITIGEEVEGKISLDPQEFLVSSWCLTTNDNPDKDSEVIWEVDFSPREVVASKRVIAERIFVEELKRAVNIDEVLDYLMVKGNKEWKDSAVFDHFLLVFFATLPNFATRQDISEEEVENFKESFPYEVYNLDRDRMRVTLRDYRSLNRVIDEIVACLDDETKTELARTHLKQFWFEEKCGGDLKKFVSVLKPSYWMGS